MALALIALYLVALPTILYLGAKAAHQPWWPKNFAAVLTAAVVLGVGTTTLVGWFGIK